MGIKRHGPEEIVAKLRQVEVLVGQGRTQADALREIVVTEQTYYRWRKAYGDMGTEQLRELKRLQKENEHRRRAVSNLTLDKLILAELRGRLLSPARRRWCFDRVHGRHSGSWSGVPAGCWASTARRSGMCRAVGMTKNA